MEKKILEFCLSPDLGGLELCVLDYFYAFKERGECYIAVAPESKLDNYFEDRCKIEIQRNKFFPFIPALKIAKFIDEKGIDTIHFHWTRDIATVILAKNFSKRKPQVIQSRHMTMTRFKDDFYHNWLYKNIDIIHAVTYQVKEQLLKFIPQEVRPKVEVVYLGVSEKSMPESKVCELEKKYNLMNFFVVGIVGRIEESKGQYIVIEAIEKLKELEIKLLIVGNSMDEEYIISLKSKVKALGLMKQVIFTGFTKDVDAYMQLCDVTVLATPKETFGLVVIESMLNKTPVIATASGGPLEIIEDNVDGFLFDRSPAVLSKKILRLYNDVAYKKRVSLQAYEKVKRNFDKERQMNKMYKVINES